MLIVTPCLYDFANCDSLDFFNFFLDFFTVLVYNPHVNHKEQTMDETTLTAKVAILLAKQYKTCKELIDEEIESSGESKLEVIKNLSIGLIGLFNDKSDNKMHFMRKVAYGLAFSADIEINKEVQHNELFLYKSLVYTFKVVRGLMFNNTIGPRFSCDDYTIDNLNEDAARVVETNESDDYEKLVKGILKLFGAGVPFAEIKKAIEPIQKITDKAKNPFDKFMRAYDMTIALHSALFTLISDKGDNDAVADFVGYEMFKLNNAVHAIEAQVAVAKNNGRRITKKFIEPFSQMLDDKLGHFSGLLLIFSVKA